MVLKNRVPLVKADKYYCYCSNVVVFFILLQEFKERTTLIKITEERNKLKEKDLGTMFNRRKRHSTDDDDDDGKEKVSVNSQEEIILLCALIATHIKLYSKPLDLSRESDPINPSPILNIG